MYSFSLVTPPAAEPVSLTEAKQHARIDTDADDALITGLIAAARQWAEKATGRAFMTQTWQLAIDAAPLPYGGVKTAINLPRAPLQSVASVEIFDDDDAAVAWPEENYFVDTVREPGRLALRSGCVWPAPARATNGIVVTYVGGYGSDAASVPAPIRTAICQLVAHWYEHRGDAATLTSARGSGVATHVRVPHVIEALLDPYRIRFPGI